MIGIALNLKSNNLGDVLMGDSLMIQEGSSLKAIGGIVQTLVSYFETSRIIGLLDVDPMIPIGRFVYATCILILAYT